jgi:deoxyadenosine/deoxycytidine kinase
LRNTVKDIDKNKYSVVMQKINKLCSEEALDENFKLDKYIIITERSLYTDKYVFAKMLYDQGKIEDVCYQIYLNWFDEFAMDFPINYSVYVNTDPEKCYERIHKRAREGEELIPLAYLNDCHNYHEEFLDENSGIKMSKLVLDGNVDIYENEKILEEWLDKINSFIQD